MQLLRYQLFLSYAIVLLAIWIGLLMHLDVVVDQLSLPNTAIIVYAPIWFLVCLVLYGMLSIIHGMLHFGDCPDASKELEKQVRQARVELKKKGVIVS